ncbi:hypothetical protein [Tetragenococcus koreensis]|uniref:Uncharacterized protein n=1 Tax=Tetragenococcus koreensis TaxID=290335 RepID=A0AAN4UDC5_9ENTE|nr:hypothetical protein [Tetragenococcus koreensis]GEQ50382.1 hypothetical protein TK11N_22340 [Tetragenococcus koreensis]GEQ52886.1 hypothetical protein TK12N_22300 [Tetragenococcus koreensis]GEQ55367.1 hypothetical protein TK2N_22110 [Tetragenococcus koreensis]GEQ57861.1 hypothetical protein TK4N_22040 [Tetragenococcus koreensis]GEQ60359.1 hypothetical protein TK6N_21980 [Tetragenococcus koreensis]
MADIINFPDKDERLLENGNKNMEAQDFLAAKNDFKKLYQQTPTFFYAKKLVAVLQHLGDYAGALQLADDHFTAFMNDSEGFTGYFHLLLLDTQFLAAHKLLQYKNTRREFPQLKEELNQLENAQTLLSADLKSVKKKQLDYLDKVQQPIKPQDWQTLIKGVSLADFLAICQEYLPHVQNPFIPPKLIEELVQDGAQGEINVVGKKINLAELPLPEDTEVLHKTLAIIEEEVQDNPQLKMLIIPEIKAHFALLYPFLPNENEAIDWAQSYILEYKEMFGEDISTEEWSHYQQIQAKKEKLRQIYQSLDEDHRN